MSLPSTIKFKMWRASLIIATVFFIIFFGYTFKFYGGLSLLATSQAVSGTATIMLGLSFAMSGIGYWWDFLDSKVAYRKYLGLTGFWLALLYAIMLIFINPDRYFYNLADNLGTTDVLFGIGAMIIFIFMSMISRSWVIQAMGAANWRYGLRIGYLAYAMLVARAAIVDHSIWAEWWQVPLDSLPPVSLLISVFAVVIIGFRGSIFLSKLNKKGITPNTNRTNQESR